MPPSVALALQALERTPRRQNSFDGRRGSSEGYRVAVRALLLHGLSGSVRKSISLPTAPAVLRTVRHIVSVPAEVNAGSPLTTAMQLLASAVDFAAAAQLTGGALLDATEVTTNNS